MRHVEDELHLLPLVRVVAADDAVAARHAAAIGHRELGFGNRVPPPCRIAEHRDRRVEQVEHHQAARLQVRLHATQGRTLIGGRQHVLERAERQQRAREPLADLEAPHVGLDDADAGADGVGFIRELLAQPVEHRARDVEPHHRHAGARARQQHAPGAASHLEHRPSGGPSRLDEEPDVGTRPVDRDMVVELRGDLVFGARHRRQCTRSADGPPDLRSAGGTGDISRARARAGPNGASRPVLPAIAYDTDPGGTRTSSDEVIVSTSILVPP